MQKCEIHLHTPASHDYKLTKGKTYKELEVEDILEICERELLFNKEQIQTFSEQITKGNFEGNGYYKLLEEKNIPYENFKEYLTYMLIAHKLYSENIQLVVITDHNTIGGYDKLKFALNEYFKTRIKSSATYRKSIFLLLGLEISCSDKNHVVGIFDESSISEVQKLVNNHIYSTVDGTIDTSLTIIKKIQKIGGIGYIAHINSSDFLGTGLYKKELFATSHLLGFTSLNNIDNLFEKKILQYSNKRKEDFCIIYEGDSHYLEDIGIRNTWIKINELSFNSFRKALTDYKFSIYTEKPQVTDKFIKNIHVKPSDKGFLGNISIGDNGFYVDFSKDLNCIIGVRGTGKSTLLNLIDTIFSRTSANQQQLKFLAEHRVIEIEFTYNNDDYMLKFISQLDPHKEYYTSEFFLEKAFKEERNDMHKLILADHWIDLYKISGEQIGPVTGYLKNDILNNVFRQSYSINNIVHRIEKGEIGDFVKEVIFDGIRFDEIDSFLMELRNTNRNTIRKYLKEQIPSLKISMNERKKIVSEKISSFNENNKKILQIYYGHGNKPQHDFLEELLFNINRERHIKGLLLTWGDVERYLYQIIEKIDFLDFLELLLWQRFSKLEAIVSLSSVMKSNANKSLHDVNEGYEAITGQNLNSIYREIIKGLFINQNNIDACLRKYFAAKDDFDIYFNINSKESTKSQGVLLLPIETLSLGQKVAAILTFIFNFGLHTNDNTPLLIDQPEDNMDSQYIYINLVESSYS